MFRILETKEHILADNAAAAKQTREQMKKDGVVLVNLMGSPGAGKTSVLLRLIGLLGKDYRIGVMEADVDSDVDAKTIAATGARVIQLHTAGLCHMDADMTRRGLDALGLELVPPHHPLAAGLVVEAGGDGAVGERARPDLPVLALVDAPLDGRPRYDLAVLLEVLVAPPELLERAVVERLLVVEDEAFPVFVF